MTVQKYFKKSQGKSRLIYSWLNGNKCSFVVFSRERFTKKKKVSVICSTLFQNAVEKMRLLVLVLAGCLNVLKIVRSQELSVIRHSDGDIFTLEGKTRIKCNYKSFFVEQSLFSNLCRALGDVFERNFDSFSRKSGTVNCVTVRLQGRNRTYGIRH